MGPRGRPASKLSDGIQFTGWLEAHPKAAAETSRESCPPKRRIASYSPSAVRMRDSPITATFFGTAGAYFLAQVFNTGVTVVKECCMCPAVCGVHNLRGRRS